MPSPSPRRPPRSSSRGGQVTFTPVVVIDTREQAAYSFASLKADICDGGGPLVITSRRGTLRSGDYSLRGYERRVAVERKSLADLYGTLGKGRDRFERELRRLAGFQFAAVVVEAELSEILSSPPPRSKLSPKSVYRSILAWQQRYPAVHWWFVPGRAMGETTTFRILERFFKEQHAIREQPDHEPDPSRKRKLYLCGVRRRANQRVQLRSR
jgi:DNA excision repair protein ERCC-4